MFLHSIPNLGPTEAASALHILVLAMLYYRGVHYLVSVVKQIICLFANTTSLYFHPVVCSFFFFFISSSNLSRRRVDVCHTCTHGVALVWI